MNKMSLFIVALSLEIGIAWLYTLVSAGVIDRRKRRFYLLLDSMLYLIFIFFKSLMNPPQSIKNSFI